MTYSTYIREGGNDVDYSIEEDGYTFDTVVEAFYNNRVVGEYE